MAEADNSLTLTILKELQGDMRQHRTMLLQVVELLRRHDRRFDEIDAFASSRCSGPDLELMLKAELLGRLTHFETQMDERIAQLEDRLSAVERPHS